MKIVSPDEKVTDSHSKPRKTFTETEESGEKSTGAEIASPSVSAKFTLKSASVGAKESIEPESEEIDFVKVSVLSVLPEIFASV